MSKTPKEIWCRSGLYYEYVKDWSEGSWSPTNDGGVKYVRADRIEELEAKLAAAVTRLQHIAANKTTDELTVIEWDTHDTFTILDACILSARTTIAELKGERDDE